MKLLFILVSAWTHWSAFVGIGFSLCLPSYAALRKISILGDLAQGICKQQKDYATSGNVQPALKQSYDVNNTNPSPPGCEKYRFNRACKDASCSKVEKINCKNFDGLTKEKSTTPDPGAANDKTASTSTSTPGPPGGTIPGKGLCPKDGANEDICGKPVQTDAYPGLVSIQIKPAGSEKYVHACAGSIFTKDWVVSAAHCFCSAKPTDKSSVEVVAGALKLSEADGAEKNRQRMKVKEIMCHPEFNKHTYRNSDIALLRVDPPFLLNEHVQAIHLPADDLRSKGPFVLVGWSSSYSDNTVTRNPTDLREIVREYYPEDKCGNRLTAKINIDGVIWSHQLCTFHESKDYSSFVGDSGGPLYLKDKAGDKFTLIGIFSYGEDKYPTVYTEVAYYVDWVKMRSKVSCLD